MKVSDAGQVGGTHYQGEIQPIDLMDVMQPSGNVFVDFARGSIIKYAARKKGDAKQMAEDLRKVAHYAALAAQRLETQVATERFFAPSQPEPGSLAAGALARAKEMDADEARAHVQK